MVSGVSNGDTKTKYKKLSNKINKMIQSSNGLYCIKVNKVPIQNDGGANQYCANNKKLLIDFKEIDPYPIQGVEENTVAIHCTGIGYLPWHSDNGETILIPCYYSPDVSGTIISPTDIILKYKNGILGGI